MTTVQSSARFPLHDDPGGISPKGFGGIGEVEDYALTIRSAGSSWQNLSNTLDVSGDGDVSPIDALLVINHINTDPNVPNLPAAPAVPPPFLDVNGDRLITALDVLLVINHLNEQANGEGERGEVVEIPFRLADDQLAVDVAARTTPSATDEVFGSWE
mgnify:CR=1 FL=1